MSEGGQLPWKRQEIDQSRGPAGSYEALREALGDPPGGYEWECKDREWKLVPVQRKEQEFVISADPLTDPLADPTKPDSKAALPITSPNSSYAIHTVLPSDTLAGICLRYKISAIKLRQVNRFSGSNLHLAPSHLVIPLAEGVIPPVQDTSSREYKLQMMLVRVPSLTLPERKAYLDMNDWDLEAALKNAHEDVAWEKRHEHKGLPLFLPRRSSSRDSSDEEPRNDLLEPLLRYHRDDSELELPHRQELRSVV